MSDHQIDLLRELLVLLKKYPRRDWDALLATLNRKLPTSAEKHSSLSPKLELPQKDALLSKAKLSKLGTPRLKRIATELGVKLDAKDSRARLIAKLQTRLGTGDVPTAKGPKLKERDTGRVKKSEYENWVRIILGRER
jgi:hypothetical protein